MKYLVSSALVMMLSFSANAAITGTWSGQGSYAASDGYKEDCGLVRMTFTRINNDANLKIDQSISCGDIEGDLTVILDVKGGDLYSQTYKVGTITDTAISFEGVTPVNGGGNEYALSLKVDGGKMQMVDKMLYDGFAYDSVAATLQQ